jgi:hypothetical protein
VLNQSLAAGRVLAPRVAIVIILRPAIYALLAKCVARFGITHGHRCIDRGLSEVFVVTASPLRRPDQPGPVNQGSRAGAAKIRRGDQAWVAGVLEQLTDDDQQLLALVYQRRLAPAAVAAELGVDESQLRRRLAAVMQTVAGLILAPAQSPPSW